MVENKKKQRCKGSSSGSSLLLPAERSKRHAAEGDKEEIHGLPNDDKSLILSLPEALIHIVLSRTPLQDLLQVKGVCTWLYKTISSSADFHSRWSDHNMQHWVVAGIRGGVMLFDISRGRWFKKLFNKFSYCSTWRLRAAGGGLLLYTTYRSFHIVNPLTMQSYQIPNMVLRREIVLALNQKSGKVAIEFKFDSKDKSYEVIVLGNIYPEKLHVLIYRSIKKSWEKRQPHIRAPGNSINLKDFPNSVVCKDRIYCFSETGKSWISYQLSAESSTEIVYCEIPSDEFMARSDNEGYNRKIVGCKDRIVMVTLRQGGKISVCELDDTFLSSSTVIMPYWKDLIDIRIWRQYEFMSPSLLDKVSAQAMMTCCGGTDAYCISIICADQTLWIDGDKRDVKGWAGIPEDIIQSWPGLSRNVLPDESIKVVSMPFSFYLSN